MRRSRALVQGRQESGLLISLILTGGIIDPHTSVVTWLGQESPWLGHGISLGSEEDTSNRP